MVAKGKDQAEPGISCQVFIKLLDCWAEITLLPFLSFTIYFNYIVSYAFLGHPKKNHEKAPTWTSFRLFVSFNVASTCSVCSLKFQERLCLSSYM